MYKCKHHTIGTLVQMYGKTTIRPNELVAIVKITNKVAIGYIKRKGRVLKITFDAKLIGNFIKYEQKNTK